MLEIVAALGRIDTESLGPGAYLLAFGGGVVSFLSPCVLPLLPAYLSLVTGLDVATISDEGRVHTRRIVLTTGAFVLGFGSVFVALGLSATAVGRFLFDNEETLTRVSGAVMLAMALFLVGSLFLRAPFLYQERRFRPDLGRWGRAAPFVAGVAFGFGWTPCIGPVLGSVFAVAANQDRALAGGSLLAVYALGLGIPFLVSGLALARVSGPLGWVKRHSRGIVLGSALVLGAFGLVLVTDNLTRVTAELQSLLDAWGLDWMVELG